MNLSVIVRFGVNLRGRATGLLHVERYYTSRRKHFLYYYMTSVSLDLELVSEQNGGSSMYLLPSQLFLSLLGVCLFVYFLKHKRWSSFLEVGT
jgi:hypothetical protein